jgi:hypothetical protein
LKFASKKVSLSCACFSGVFVSLEKDAWLLAEGADLGVFATPLAVFGVDGRCVMGLVPCVQALCVEGFLQGIVVSSVAGRGADSVGELEIATLVVSLPVELSEQLDVQL